MTEKKDHSNLFTPEDIHRYHSGKMPLHEMHLLEKAALDDPFLADALEGYSYAAEPVADTEELKTALQERLQGKKENVLPLFQRKKLQWLRIAALVLLIAGAGWLVYVFTYTPVTDNVAATTQKASEEKADFRLNKKVESGHENVSDTGTVKDKAAEEPVRKKTEKAALINTPNDAVKDESSIVSLPASSKKSEINTYRYNDNPANKDAAHLNIDASHRPVADSVDAETAVVPKEQTVTPGTDNVIVMRRVGSDPIPEVILGNSKKDSASLSKRPQVVFEEAVPEKGEIYYNDYLAENLKLPESADLKSSPGVVQLSFDVNELGEAININVEKSLCEACDREAIRILKEGPKLQKKKKNTKGKVTIRF